MRKLSSIHAHTIFCDGKDNAETMCRAAYEKSLYAIGFSSHMSIKKQTGIITGWQMSEDRLDEYKTEALAAKKRWLGKIEVFFGIELDYIKGLRSANDSDIKLMKFDYIIGSVHYLMPVNGAQAFTVDGSLQEFEQGLSAGFNGDGEALMNYYYDMLLEMIMSGGFDILGHADLVKKNTQQKKYWNAENEKIRQKEIAVAAAKTGIIIEVNTGGINRGKLSETYPSLSFLRFFREEDVPVIITADAHEAAHLDGHYDTAIQTIMDAGYSNYILPERKNDNTINWVKENII
ncbi:MAG: histidinol-phosphatase [Treponema sp.]|jgi:histidinol-phosphatase (PHP family)|nr:histidinol-phosphatase [Treponema sp.]